MEFMPPRGFKGSARRSIVAFRRLQRFLAMSETFETALTGRVDAMVDACTQCGKCVEVCPITEPAGVADEPPAVIGGVIDILRGGEGTKAARAWASACVASGECIKACDYGVNPRFLLAMTRVAIARKDDAAVRRRKGVENFRRVARDVTHLSRLQLEDELLERLGQRTGPDRDDTAAQERKPDFVFYTGCNVLKTPHIALLALDVMDTLGVTYRVLGGPTHCCGVQQLRAGDTETLGRVAESTLEKLAASKTGQVLAWCPSCQVQFSEVTLPTIERARGARPFEMTPFMRFLGEKLDQLRPLLREAVPLRVALHRHPGVAGVMQAAERVLRAVPGLELVELGVPAVGLMSNALATLPAYKRDLYRRELDAAQAAGVDALVAVYHADHRELCAHEREYTFRILNVLDIVGQSMGITRDDHYKRLKLMQDIDAIAADCQDLATRHQLPPETTRQVIAAMLADQPVPLRAG
jgi:heterodisulfide reductase subunit D